MGKKHVGLFFGTFNPIHVGHLILGNYIAQQDDMDEVWMVVTPKNPFKQKNSLLEDVHRLALVRAAVENNPRLKVSSIEFDLPQPNYTVDTLAYLGEKYPKIKFSVMMGEDNLNGLNKWKNYQVILDNHDLIVYPRVSAEGEEERIKSPFLLLPNVNLVDAPLMKISSSKVRKMIQHGMDVQYLLTPAVYQYIDEMNFYKK